MFRFSSTALVTSHLRQLSCLTPSPAATPRPTHATSAALLPVVPRQIPSRPLPPQRSPREAPTRQAAAHPSPFHLPRRPPPRPPPLGHTGVPATSPDTKADPKREGADPQGAREGRSGSLTERVNAGGEPGLGGGCGPFVFWSRPRSGRRRPRPSPMWHASCAHPRTPGRPALVSTSSHP